jgi:iron(III) transport system permease protein
MATEAVAQGDTQHRALRLSSARVSFSTLLCTLVLATVAFLVVYPVVLLLFHSFEVGTFGQATHPGLDNWRAALTQPDLAAALWNTVSLALARQVIALPIAIAVAWLIARTDLPGRDWLEFGFWVTVFLPQLTVVLGWIMFLDSFNGVANKLVEQLPFVQKGPFNIYSWWGIVWTHLMSGTIALKIMLLTPAFRNVDASMEEASRASGASTFTTIVRIAAPLLAPTILVLTLLSTIRSFETFETEYILGNPANIDVFSTKIFRLAHREPPDYGIATALAMAMLSGMLPFIALQQWYSSRRSYATVSSRFKGGLVRLGRWKWPLCAFVFGLVLLMTLLPIALVVMGSFMKLFGFFNIQDAWTLDHWRTATNSPNFTRALTNTLIISGGKALLCMVTFSVIAYIMVRTKFAGRGLLDFFVWLPSTLPGIIMGLGFLWLFLGTPILRPLYGTTFLLILVTALGTITLGTQILKSNLMQLGAELEEASWASGGSWWYTFRRIILPLILPTVIVIGVLAFSSAARTTGSIALLSTSSNQPLSILQLNLMAENNMAAGSVVGIFILFLTIGVSLLARVFGLRGGLSGGR